MNYIKLGKPLAEYSLNAESYLDQVREQAIDAQNAYYNSPSDVKFAKMQDAQHELKKASQTVKDQQVQLLDVWNNQSNMTANQKTTALHIQNQATMLFKRFCLDKCTSVTADHLVCTESVQQYGTTSTKDKTALFAFLKIKVSDDDVVSAVVPNGDGAKMKLKLHDVYKSHHYDDDGAGGFWLTMHVRRRLPSAFVDAATGEPQLSLASRRADVKHHYKNGCRPYLVAYETVNSDEDQESVKLHDCPGLMFYILGSLNKMLEEGDAEIDEILLDIVNDDEEEEHDFTDILKEAASSLNTLRDIVGRTKDIYF